MVKGAQTKLEGMKESKRSKTFEHTTKINQYNDAQNQMKKKRKKKDPNPTLGCMMDHLANQFQGPEIHRLKKGWETNIINPKS